MKVKCVMVIAGMTALVLGAVIAGATPRDGGSGPMPGGPVPGGPVPGGPMPGGSMPCGSMPGGPMPGGGMHGMLGPIGWALHEIDLTLPQKQQIDTIVLDARATLGALRQQQRKSESAFRDANPPTKFDEAAIRAHVADRAKLDADLMVAEGKARLKVLGVLTTEQRAKLEQLLAAGPDMDWQSGPPPRW